MIINVSHTDNQSRLWGGREKGVLVSSMTFLNDRPPGSEQWQWWCWCWLSCCYCFWWWWWWWLMRGWFWWWWWPDSADWWWWWWCRWWWFWWWWLWWIDGDYSYLVDEDCSSSLARWPISRADWLYPDLLLLWWQRWPNSDMMTAVMMMMVVFRNTCMSSSFWWCRSTPSPCSR